MRLVVVGLVGAMGCMTPVMTFGDGKTAKQAQRETMADFTPARLVVDEKYPGDVVAKRVRIWADVQYRAQNVKWQQTFEATLELANVVLEPLYGLQLVGEYHVWDRHAPSAALAEHLEALRAVDAGDGVLAVIGLTSSLPLVSATFDELGLAMVNGHHLVMRGYNDIEERKLYAEAFQDLLPAERAMALEQKRQHKTAVLLLHELGHNFGYEHDPDADLIMSASYSTRAVRFSADARQAIARRIDERVGRRVATAVPPVPAPTTPTPAAPTPTAPVAAAPLVLHVTWTGDVFRGNRGMTDAEIDALLAEAFTRGAATEVVIKRARKAPSTVVQRIMERATSTGLTRISVTTY